MEVFYPRLLTLLLVMQLLQFRNLRKNLITNAMTGYDVLVVDSRSNSWRFLSTPQR